MKIEIFYYIFYKYKLCAYSDTDYIKYSHIFRKAFFIHKY